MKRVMLVSMLEGEQDVTFYDDLEKAIHDCDILMVSLGGYGEVYERQDPCEENDYAEGYVLVYNM